MVAAQQPEELEAPSSDSRSSWDTDCEMMQSAADPLSSPEVQILTAHLQIIDCFPFFMFCLTHIVIMCSFSLTNLFDSLRGLPHTSCYFI